MENGVSSPGSESKKVHNRLQACHGHADNYLQDAGLGRTESQSRITVLEDRIETLEKALQALLKEKDEAADKEKSKDEEEAQKPTDPELTEEEKLDQKNWTRRFQWRRTESLQGRRRIHRDRIPRPGSREP